ncbi:MAG: hypothetical protein IPN20_12525 [Haliscomenobacter sp.]|nr:hypothetical protein [Haliscomenobacter sp.]
MVSFLVYSVPMTLENGANIFEDPAQCFVNVRSGLMKGYITFIGSRHRFDFNYFAKNTGWKLFDTRQDASCFGVWVHEEDRRIVTYAEGDLTEVTCPDQDGFLAEIRSMEVFYGPAPPAFRVIDRESNVAHL